MVGCRVGGAVECSDGVFRFICFCYQLLTFLSRIIVLSLHYQNITNCQTLKRNIIMKKEPKRFITRFRHAHNLYDPKYNLTSDVKNFLLNAVWMALYSNVNIRLSSAYIAESSKEIFSEGKFRYKRYLIDLSPLLDEIDVNKGRVIYL